jgi:hypothetical protein
MDYEVFPNGQLGKSSLVSSTSRFGTMLCQSITIISSVVLNFTIRTLICLCSFPFLAYFRLFSLSDSTRKWKETHASSVGKNVSNCKNVIESDFGMHGLLHWQVLPLHLPITISPGNFRSKSFCGTLGSVLSGHTLSPPCVGYKLPKDIHKPVL